MAKSLYFLEAAMRIYGFGHEKCPPDHKPFRKISAKNTCHYVVAGQGYFNGIKVSSGMGFISRYGKYVEFCQDPSDPWEYYWISMEGDASSLFPDAVSSDENGIFHHDLQRKLSAFFELVYAINPMENDSLWTDTFPKIALSLHKPDNVQALNCGKRYVYLAKKMIDDNLNENLQIGEIADRLCISRCYLRDVFVRYEGMSPLQYKQKRRMEYACWLLHQSNYPIGMIASSIGYDDPLRFSREFRKHFSLSPTEYRKSFNDNAE